MSKVKLRMNDLLVILPGITGSALAKDGEEIWAPAPRMMLGYIRSRGQSLESMVLHADPEHDDGVRATRLIPYTLIPGLDCFDGYTGLKSHLVNNFDLTIGDTNLKDGPPANYFEFPYDWRKDNAVSAQSLKEMICRELGKWKTHSDNPDAKVILIGHSMGGLVARYYVEMLQGFEKTRALITFGTPYRGSVQAVDYLANGYRKLGHELKHFTAMMRSFPSVYQLLPRYEAVLDADGNWKRIFDVTRNLAHLDRERAQESHEFYRKIDAAYEQNRNLKEYRIELLPIFGWGHETPQSAAIKTDGSVELQVELPLAVDPVFQNGDGTVPRVSAIPIELNDKPVRWWPVNQKHATMQNNRDLLANLVQVLAAMQGHLRVPARALDSIAEGPKIGLVLDDVYLIDEPVSIRVTLNANSDPGEMKAQIEPYSGVGIRDVELKPDGQFWAAHVTGLSPGSYRVTVNPQNQAVGPRDPVCDIFEVL